MSVLTDVLDAVRRGVPGQRVAAHLGADPGLVDLALDHWVRLGVVTPAGDLQLGCTTCAGLDDGVRAEDPERAQGSGRVQRAPSCAGCPFSR